MKRAFGLKPAVDGSSVDCPTCERKKGLPCANKAAARIVCDNGFVFEKGDWIGASRRCHPARITAAIEARQARERGKA